MGPSDWFEGMSCVPTRINTDQLKRRVRRAPFDARVKFVSNHCKCPFHNGDTNTSMSIFERGGIWLTTCHSECAKTFDAISFVMAYDKVDFPTAIASLGEKVTGEPHSVSVAKDKPKPKRMTQEEWLKWGRELTPADIERLAKSRKDKTASFEAFQQLGCRVRGDWIGFPYSHMVFDPDTGVVDGIEFDLVKLRHLDDKDFIIENSISQHGLFNLDAVNPFEDVYVLEGEPDAALMEDTDFRAVSVVSGSQKKFSAKALEILKQAPRIFIVGDQVLSGDEDPGEKCMDVLQRNLPIEKTFRIKFSKAHDVCELARKLGDSFAERVEELRDDSLEPWVTKNLPSITQLSQEPVKWVVDRMVPYGGLTMFAGSQGSMKSLLAMYLAKAISGGSGQLEGFLGRKVWSPSVPVLYIDRENPEGMVSERARFMGIRANRDFIYWGDFSGDQTPELDDHRLMEFAHRRKGLIVFDSLQDWYGDLKSENDNVALVQLMGKFRRLARAGAGVVLLHHNRKPSKGDEAPIFRGGTVFVALTDMAISVGKSKEDSNVIQLRESRMRMCATWEIDFRAHWDAGDFHKHAKHYQLELLRDQLKSEVIANERNEQRTAASAKQQKDETDTARILELITGNFKTSPITIEKKTSPSINRKRVVRLAAAAGWVWSDDTWMPGADAVDGDGDGGNVL
jgi:hypothetical protein